MDDIKIIDKNTIIVNGTKYIAKKANIYNSCKGCAFVKMHAACRKSDCVNSITKRDVIFVYMPKSYDEVINEYKQPNTTLLKTWEEFCDKYPMTDTEYFIANASSILRARHITKIRDKNVDRNLCSNLQTAKAFLALMQLIRLRDVYNNYWKPNWCNNTEDKHVIKLNRNDIVIHQFNIISNPLYFKSLKLAEEFLNNFRDLIEEAKELI